MKHKRIKDALLSGNFRWIFGKIAESLGYVQLDPDQTLPDNGVWHKNEREFEAYCAGRNDMLKARFKKVL